MFSVPPPSPLHAKACVLHNCNTDAHIRFIFDTSIDGPEWKNIIDFGENRKPKYEKACARHNMYPKCTHQHVAIDLSERKVPIDLGEKCSHFVNTV